MTRDDDVDRWLTRWLTWLALALVAALLVWAIVADYGVDEEVDCTHPLQCPGSR